MENKFSFRQVYDAVTRTIGNTYPKRSVYGKKVMQGLTEDSFNVIPISATDIKEMGDRIKRSVTFDCVYYSENYDELLSVADELPLILQSVEVASKRVIHGSLRTPTTEIEDGVVHCIVSYTFFGLQREVLSDGEEGLTDLMYYLEYSSESEVK